MGRAAPILLVLAVVFTLGALAGWGATGWHAYTKYEVIEQVPARADRDDPFADTAFFDEDEEAPALDTVRRDEFHLGMLPTPEGVFDKHAISVLTIVVPIWGLFGLAAALRRRSRR